MKFEIYTHYIKYSEVDIITFDTESAFEKAANYLVEQSWKDMLKALQNEI